MRECAVIGLSNPKFDVNVASVLRAAACFGVPLVCATGRRYKRHGADTQDGLHRVLLQSVEDLRASIPFGCVPVAVELHERATSLVDYQHPPRAFYVFGAEDNTLGHKTLSWCRDVIQIPTRGCLNLAMTVNVVLYDRLAKQMRGDYE